MKARVFRRGISQKREEFLHFNKTTRPSMNEQQGNSTLHLARLMHEMNIERPKIVNGYVERELGQVSI